jgi:hypothetical protein
MAVDIKRRYDKDTGKTLTYVTNEEKRKEPFVIIPHRKGYAGYEVFVHHGEVPMALAGHFVRIAEAEQACITHLDQMKPTKTVERDAKTKRREETKTKES